MAKKCLVYPGATFGRLTILEKIGRRESRTGKTVVTMWLCACACGKQKSISNANLTKGITSSCGCLHKEMLLRRNTKHGRANTPMYKVWLTMVQRCTNPNCRNWADYGGRGITVCDTWRQYETFYADMSETYAHGLTLERVDNDGPYAKWNCVWASRTAQGSNKRNTVWFVLDGVSVCTEEAARRLGVTSGALRYRKKRAMSDQDIADTLRAKYRQNQLRLSNTP